MTQLPEHSWCLIASDGVLSPAWRFLVNSSALIKAHRGGLVSAWSFLSRQKKKKKRQWNGEPIYLLAVKCVRVTGCKPHIFKHDWCVLYSRLLVLWHFVHHHNTGKWFNRAWNTWAKSFDPLHGSSSIIIWACWTFVCMITFFALIQCCVSAYIFAPPQKKNPKFYWTFLFRS